MNDNFMQGEDIIYVIPAPDSINALIIVYGWPKYACYEWKIHDGTTIIKDTGKEGGYAFKGRQYGQPEIALRDALMVASGLPDPYR